MRTLRILMVVLGLLGVLLTTIPTEGGGGSSQTGQVGWASWYGKQHQGRKTASGERFSRSQLTAAHRSLSLGTKVKVTNLRTGQHVVVKINDRGPHGRGNRRIIDLSEAAAKHIGLAPRGVDLVRVVVVEEAPKVPHPTHHS
jgi:rare lipoprotein A